MVPSGCRVGAHFSRSPAPPVSRGLSLLRVRCRFRCRGGRLTKKAIGATEASHGWDSLFPEFRDTQPRVIRTRLGSFSADASIEQLRAWDDSIPLLQREVRELCGADPAANECTAILEYELPLESRRPDIVLLVRGAIVVLELKGKESPTQADLDQAAAYARDLRCYHRACDGKPVHAVVVPTRSSGRRGVRDGVHVVGPDGLDSLVQDLQPAWEAPTLSAEEFLAEDAYRPLPTLVQAARELFQPGTVRRVWRAAADTDPTVEEIARIVHEAARNVISTHGDVTRRA